MAAPIDRYELMRQRASRQGRTAIEDQSEAMKRRFAASGGLGSGASMRVMSQVEQKGQQQLAENLQGVDLAQAQEQYQEAEQEKGRQFSRAEREAAQAFGAGEAEKQRGFAMTEREAAQKFAANESTLGRELQEKMFNKDYSLRKSQITQARKQFNRTMAFEAAKFEHQKDIDSFNKEMSGRIQSYNEQPGLMDKLTTLGNVKTYTQIWDPKNWSF